MPVESERTSRPGTRTFDDKSMFPRGHGLQMPGASEGTSPWISKRTATLHDDPATSTTGTLCPTPPYSSMPESHRRDCLALRPGPTRGS